MCEKLVLPQVIAYPLETAGERLKKAGFEFKVIKTLPPGYREPSDARYRVVRQQLKDDRIVELVVTIDLGKRG